MIILLCYLTLFPFSSCSAASFTALDRNYLTPFFTSHNGDMDDDFGEDVNSH